VLQPWLTEMQKGIAHDRNYTGKGRFNIASDASCATRLRVGKIPAEYCHVLSKPKILGLFSEHYTIGKKKYITGRHNHCN